MHTIRFSAILMILLGLLSSCEKVIDLKLNNSAPQTVIEGTVSNEAGGAKVSISLSKKFTDDSSFDGIGGALVSVEADGTVYNFDPTATGVYQNSILVGIPGHTYHLTVKLNDKTYTSTSTMPQITKLDSIYVVDDELGTNKDKTKLRVAAVKYQDPANEKNYYRFIQYIDGRKEKSLMIDDDEFTNGQTVNSRINFNNDNDDPAREIRTGKQLMVEMECIDAAVYKYFFSLNSGSTGNGNNAAPSNPTSNITGGVLGYFSAYPITRKTITVPAN
ncbi:DUF4249 domain-containing protein [Mucilaginibacter sp. RCC_168]|uniref:DUF4249 domain-containing protein n=1 Tax=unclassified Mucilaginibacter TaxID=2617802 RepID=UPI003526ADB1